MIDKISIDGPKTIRVEAMRGAETQQEALFSYLSLESRIRRNHPLRPIRELVNTGLCEQLDYNLLFRWLVGPVGG